MTWTVDQRAELRAAFEQSRREALAESRRLAAVKPAAIAVTPAQVLRAVMTPAAPPPPPPSRPIPDVSHCVFCGAKTRNWADVCHAHSDLLEATG